MALKAAIASLAVLLAALAIVAWALWFPSAKEPPYVMAAAWAGLGAGLGRFDDPTGVAVTDALVFVSDARNGRIQMFDHDGLYLREMGAGAQGAEALVRPGVAGAGASSMRLAASPWGRAADLYVADF